MQLVTSGEGEILAARLNESLATMTDADARTHAVARCGAGVRAGA